MSARNVTRVSRRTLNAGAAGIIAGVFATGFRQATGQEASPEPSIATPVSTQPAGFVSTRLRTVESLEARAEINERVRSEFAPDVEKLDGFEGYLLGDVVGGEGVANLSILILEDEAQAAAFADLAADFVGGLEESVSSVGTEQWAGDLLLTGRPASGNATPIATPVGPRSDGYVAYRVYTSTPGTDPHDFVPLVRSGFLPIVTGLKGFQGYLLYIVDGGFASISLFDSAESAEESNTAGQAWAKEFLSEFTDGTPQIINADVVYSNLPILR